MPTKYKVSAAMKYNKESQENSLGVTKRPSRDAFDPGESSRIMKTVIVLGLSFTLLFSAYKGMLNLQSSVNSQAGLGVYTLAVCAGSFALSSLFLPPFCLAKLKCKWTILISMSGFIVYQMAQFYPRFETLVPAALFLGTCCATIWTAQSSYLTVIAEEYAILKGEDSKAVTQRLFGIFYLFFQSSQISGNVLSSFILSRQTNTLHQNCSANLSHDLENCGANLCAADLDSSNVATFAWNDKRTKFGFKDEFANENISIATNMKILIGIFLGCTVGSAIIVYFFVDSLSRYGEGEGNELTKTKWYSLFVVTIKHWRKPTQILLTLTINNMGYITCAWGVEKIGYVLICFGACAALASIIVGKVTKHVGCLVIFLIAASLNAGCLITMLYWKPNPSEPALFFILAGLWGVADGIWSPQLKALYGTLFYSTREAGFSNTHLWMSLGYVIVYLSSELMCMETKLFMNLGFLGIAMICYGVVEIMTRSTKSKQSNVEA